MKQSLQAPTPAPFSEHQLQAVTRHLNVPDVALPFWGQRKRIPAYRITWLEGKGNYTVVHFCDGTEMIVSLTLKKLEGRLSPELFVRPHKKCIINLLYLQEIRSGKTTSICLANGCEIEVSRRKTTQFMKLVITFQQEFLPLKVYYGNA
ncbi:LytR/AlgR family response regulator transcription factor [Larkinella sp. VNQ87]|uniref:LytR/AlgR family response regulator transcription factor n=1 Tax=Larkinella sp. VNQ87 TaxID=3400921 RepID=UPI003C063315